MRSPDRITAIDPRDVSFWLTEDGRVYFVGFYGHLSFLADNGIAYEYAGERWAHVSDGRIDEPERALTVAQIDALFDIFIAMRDHDTTSAFAYARSFARIMAEQDR